MLKWVNGFRLKPYLGPTPLNPFTDKNKDNESTKVGKKVATVPSHHNHGRDPTYPNL